MMVLSLTAFAITGSLVSLPPIENVTIGDRRELRVNDQPFFPLMIWLQDPGNWPRAAEAGINTIAGYWPGSGGTADVVDYYQRIQAAGFYAVLPFDRRLKGASHLLGYLHGDEPDLTHLVSDARIEAGAGLRINSSAPLWKLVDGVTSSWSVLDPLLGAEVTIPLEAPVTIRAVAVHLTISPGLAVARQVTFLGDGKPVLTTPLAGERGRQRFDLPQPISCRALTLRIDEVTPGEEVWGSLGEIEAFDEADRNVLLSPPRRVVRTTPEECERHLREIRAHDPDRPVFMTLTAHFMPVFGNFTEEERQDLYPRYIAAADVVGFDIYPLYGWGRADFLPRVSEGQRQLVGLAGRRPTYQWIETSKGGQWVSEANQLDVTPEHIRAEVWMAICRGAGAIGYFTHIWKPAYKQFGVPPENVAMMRVVNEQITRLAPAILAEPVEAGIELSDDVVGDVTARRHDGALYVFAVNSDHRRLPAEATIRVPGLPAGTTVEVIDEDRALTAEAGSFRDHFDGLAVHLYRVGVPSERDE